MKNQIVENVAETFDRAVELYKQSDEFLSKFQEGTAPGTVELDGEQQAKWFASQMHKAQEVFPPQYWLINGELKFGSLWMLTRPFVKGWDKELRRFERYIGIGQSNGV